MSILTEWPTFATILAEVEEQAEIDVSEDDGLASEAEIKQWCNTAVERAETMLMTIYEDYFLVKTEFALVPGQDNYPKPTDIYAMKIRSMVYHGGSNDVYEIKKARDWRKAYEWRFNKTHISDPDNDCYEWFIMHETPSIWEIYLTPIPGEGSVDLWYLRQANRIVDNTDIIDIPEAKNYIKSYILYRLSRKEHKGSTDKSDVNEAKEDMVVEYRLLRQALLKLAPDLDTEIDKDFTHYEEHN